MRGRWVIFAIVLVAAPATWLAVRAMENRRLDSELRLARGEFGARRFGRPEPGLRGWPSDGPIMARFSTCSEVAKRSKGAWKPRWPRGTRTRRGQRSLAR